MPNLSDYGGRMVETDGIPTVELCDPNDNARRVFQYRRTADGGVERRVLMEGGEPFDGGSPWEALSAMDLEYMRGIRGPYHPILDPLGL